MSRSASSEWNILVVRTQHEQDVSSDLYREGVDAWAPYERKTVVKRHRRGSARGRHKITRTVTKLPGYVFVPAGTPLVLVPRAVIRDPQTGRVVGGDKARDLVRDHPYIRGVVTRLLPTGEAELARVTTEAVLRTGARIEQMPQRHGRLDLRPGDMARLLFGPLADYTVEIRSIDDRTARVRFSMLGAEQEESVDVASLEPV